MSTQFLSSEQVIDLQAKVQDLERQLAEQKRITDSIITVDVAGLRKAWEEAKRQLAEARSCDIWLTNNLSLWMAFMMKAHRDADRALAEAQGKLREALKELHNWKANNSPRTSLWFHLARILHPKEGE